MSEKLEFDIEVGKNDLSKNLEDASKKAGVLERNLETAVSVFAGNLLTKAFDTFIDGLSSVVNLADESIDAAAAQEVAINNLNAALARAGNFSKEASEELQAFATQMQSITKFEDDAIQSSTALLQSLTKLSVDGLQNGISAAADFATVLGVDLETATRLVAKAANGNAEAFSRYGIAVQQGSNNTETFNNVLEKLNQNFGGAAAAQLNTYSGSLTSLSNAYGDLLEPIGDIIVKNPTVVALFNATKDVLNELNTSISSGNGVFKEFVTDGIFAAIASAQVLFDALDGLTRIFKATIDVLGILGNAIGFGIIEPFRAAIDTVLTLLQSLPLIGSAFESITNPLAEFSDKLKSGVVDGIEELKESVTGENIFTKLSDGTAQFGNKIVELSEQVQLSAGVFKNSNDSRVLDEDETNKEIISQRQDLNNQLLLLQGQFAAEEKAFRDQAEIAKMAAGFEKDTASIEALKAQKLLEIDAVYQAELQKAELIKNEQNKELAREAAFGKAKLAQQKVLNKASLDQDILQAKFEKDLQASRVAALQGFLAAGISLAKEGSKEQKVLQTASAVAATYTAANLALQSPPGPPYTIPLVAATIAQGLANVARINAVKFNNGGFIGGSNGVTNGPDNIMAEVKTGEMVLNGIQQEKLFNMINTGGNGGDIVIQIDGRTIATAVRDQIKGGFKLA